MKKKHNFVKMKSNPYGGTEPKCARCDNTIQKN